MKKELDEFITVLDDAVDMQDNGKYQDILDNAYQDGTFHDLRRYLNKQTKRMRELEEDEDYLYELIDKVAKVTFSVEQQNKRYREVIDKLNNPPEEHEYTAEAYAHYVVSVLKALEESE